MADNQPVATSLVERMRSVPLDAVLRIDTPNALGCMDTRSIPVGRLCHEAADALGMPASPNFKCIYCGWVGAVNPKDPACGNSRCVEPYPGKCAPGVGIPDGSKP